MSATFLVLIGILAAPRSASGQVPERSSRTPVDVGTVAETRKIGCRIQGRVVRDEDGIPVWRFRIHLRGATVHGVACDGWHSPTLKKGFVCRRYDPSRVVDDADELAAVESRADAEKREMEAPAEYRFDRRVLGGTGEFEWRIEADGRDPAMGRVLLEKGTASDLGEIRLKRASGSIEGRVTDEAARPVADASVQLTGLTRDWRVKEPGWDRVRTDADGRYRFKSVPAGEGFVHVRPGPVPPIAAAPVSVAVGRVTRCDLRPELGSLCVRVETREGIEWTEPMELCLQWGHTTLRWPVIPPRAAAGRTFTGGGSTSGFATSHLDAIWLYRIQREALPTWVPSPPTISSVRPADEVAIASGEALFTVRNVPAGTWSVRVWGVERRRPIRDAAGGFPAVVETEWWEAPPLRPFPDRVTVNVGETTSLALFAR